jgi:hypothetical protein
MKIVINACFGGFTMSEEAITLYKSYIHSKDPDLKLTEKFFECSGSKDLANISRRFLKEEAIQQSKAKTSEPKAEQVKHKNDVENDLGVNIPRYDPCLVRVIEELGPKASVSHSCLTVVEIEDDIDWIIQEYDGYEWIAHNHKILTYYPLYPDKLIHGIGTQSQELYDPNKENDLDTYIQTNTTNPCFIQ